MFGVATVDRCTFLFAEVHLVVGKQIPACAFPFGRAETGDCEVYVSRTGSALLAFLKDPRASWSGGVHAHLPRGKLELFGGWTFD